jgi:hypothetical protein
MTEELTPDAIPAERREVIDRLQRLYYAALPDRNGVPFEERSAVDLAVCLDRATSGLRFLNSHGLTVVILEKKDGGS